MTKQSDDDDGDSVHETVLANLGATAAAATNDDYEKKAIDSEHNSNSGAESRNDPAMLQVITTAASFPAVYSVFSPRMKACICAMASLSAIMSPLATSIYFPSITLIAEDLGVSVEHVNLTVTTYMILQGIAPTFWGSVADGLGRRPVYLATLTVFALANLGLALQETYAGLIVLRMVQSSGSSATVAIGAGTIADIYAQNVRGTYMGVFNALVMMAPAVAPVFGGLLSLSADSWRASFWFLLAVAVALGIGLFVFMPETGRNVVGNGSIPARGINVSVLAMLRKRPRDDEEEEFDEGEQIPPRRFRNPMRCVLMILEKDVASVLFSFGLIYLGYYCVTVGFAAQLASTYNLTTLEVGLCFLPYGAGCSVGSILVGKFLDRDFLKFARSNGYGELVAQGGSGLRKKPDFPLEKARLRTAWIQIAMNCVFTCAFGWCFRSDVSLAGPLIILFCVGFSFNAYATTIQVLIVDLYPQDTASVTAANNLVRCLLGAAGTAVIDRIISAVGMGWTYTIVAGIDFIAAPILLLDYVYGGMWRRERYYRLQAKEKAARSAQIQTEAEAGTAEKKE
ncbi:major facilitator superfamily domain-containing protein [Limtongia smithiae]|uniref:major facilitator superfamily domain-containing protein n=1 Tax=Limtongia smithiae TaxID=1125753 RepID=UPI0034CEC051